MRLAVTVLIFCVGALLTLGMVMLYSASMVHQGAHLMLMQVIWGLMGITVCVVMTLLDYRILKKVWWLLLGAALVMLALVLVPKFGAVRGHARRWFSVGGLNIQPSEFAKIAMIIALAWYCEHFQRQMRTWKRGILIPGAFVCLAALLMFKEPDVGSALVLGSVCGVIMLIAGIRLTYFLPPVIAVLLAVGVFIAHNPMRSQRIYSWMHLEETRQGKGMQAYEAMVALGSGGVAGKGLGDGRQKYGFVPEHHTDFIFSVIGEELGLIATLLVVVAFVTVVFCGLYVSMHARDAFGLFLGAGITFLLGLQAFINIGVVTSALPNKGLPLPFISYGGSNLLMMLASVGILLSIARHARQPDAISLETSEPAGIPSAQPA